MDVQYVPATQSVHQQSCGPDCLGPYCKHHSLSLKKEIKKDTRHNKLRSKQQERTLAKEYVKVGFERARRVPMSGAISQLPADVDPGEMFLVEAKMTRTGKMMIEPRWINQVRAQAEAAGREYLLHAWVAGGLDQYTKVVVMDERVWLDIVKQLKEYMNVKTA